jgi:phenylpyruvate tautomerase PptA (4-oxalocrotonate tautomerase family)
MPIIEVRLPAGRLDPATKTDLAERLTALLIQMEGGADTEGGRGFAWVLFTEVPAGDWWIGGQTDERYVSASGRFLVHVTIPEGYMDAATKSGVQSDVTRAILAASGVPEGEPADWAHSILVVIDEVTEGNWAAGGRTISIASIADTVGLPKSGARFQWVRDYFGAKARQFGAAGYPSGVGGLLAPQASRQ